MKLSVLGLAFAAFSQLVLTMPSGLIKQASVSDTCDFGFCTMNGGTTGGRGGKIMKVTTFPELQAAVFGDCKAIVIISGTISGEAVVKVGSNKSILGEDKNAQLIGIGLKISKKQSNIIIRNFKISNVLATTGDAIGIQSSYNIWIDHMDISSDRDHDKDYYDGLLDVNHGSDWITVSYSHFHDHWKASLVGSADNTSAEDSGHLTITYKHNYWNSINSRAPSLRFGTGHIYNNLFCSVLDAVNTRDGAQLLVENNVFEYSKRAVFSTDGGYAVSRGNDFGNSSCTALPGSLTSMPYKYSLIDTYDTKAHVLANSGNILSFGDY